MALIDNGHGTLIARGLLQRSFTHLAMVDIQHERCAKGIRARALSPIPIRLVLNLSNL